MGVKSVMPALSNVRWEMFCVNLVAGMPQGEAHRKAGFTGTGSGNSILKLPQIKARIAELIEDKTKFKEKFNSDPLSPFASELDKLKTTGIVSKEWISEQLMSNAKEARDNNQFAAANAALRTLSEMFGYLKTPTGNEPVKLNETKFTKLSIAELNTILDPTKNGTGT